MCQQHPRTKPRAEATSIVQTAETHTQQWSEACRCMQDVKHTPGGARGPPAQSTRAGCCTPRAALRCSCCCCCTAAQNGATGTIPPTQKKHTTCCVLLSTRLPKTAQGAQPPPPHTHILALLVTFASPSRIRVQGSYNVPPASTCLPINQPAYSRLQWGTFTPDTQKAWHQTHTERPAYTAPCASMALATFSKPAMLAPSAKVTPNSLAAEEEAA